MARVGEEQPEIARARRRDVAEPVRDEEQVPALQDELVDPGRLGLRRGVRVAEQVLRARAAHCASVVHPSSAATAPPARGRARSAIAARYTDRYSARHPVRTEAAPRPRLDRGAIEGRCAPERDGHLAHPADEEPRLAVLDDLGSGAERVRDDRTPGERGLDHHEPERLLPAQRHEERPGRREEPSLHREVGLAQPAHVRTRSAGASTSSAHPSGAASPWARPATVIRPPRAPPPRSRARAPCTTPGARGRTRLRRRCRRRGRARGRGRDGRRGGAAAARAPPAAPRWRRRAPPSIRA